ncbi:hypothetical protein JZU71_02350 [bacterium]|nr:hypothetical protein [bacterium]
MFNFFRKKQDLNAKIEYTRDIKRLMDSLGLAKAGEIIRKQAHEGNVVCQIFLSQGSLHYGDGRDEEYTRMAAESGDPGSQYNLCLILIKKLDSSKEYFNEDDILIIREVKHWYRRATEQGFRPADNSLRGFVEAFPDADY